MMHLLSSCIAAKALLVAPAQSQVVDVKQIFSNKFSHSERIEASFKYLQGPSQKDAPEGYHS